MNHPLPPTHSAPVPFELSRANHRRNRGFTLVELLVTISIIAILAGMVLGALYTSQEAARRRRTEALIRKLHDQMAIRWESYQTRRLPIDPAIKTVPDGTFSGMPGAFPEYIEANFVDRNSPTTPELIAARTLLARRELMSMELPDQYSDLDPMLIPQFLQSPDPSTAAPNDTLPVYASLAKSYLRRIERAIGFEPTAIGDYLIIEEANESAECLYMVLTSGLASGDGAIFSERDSADTDGDGMPEFVDAWGNAIEWIRWPAGFVSDMQPLNSSGNRDSLVNPNPFDAGRIDPSPQNFDPLLPRGYGLFPLILSPGPDGSYGIAFRQNIEAPESNDPYGFHPSLGADIDRQRGENFLRAGDPSYEGLELDNVHNHLLNQ